MYGKRDLERRLSGVGAANQDLEKKFRYVEIEAQLFKAFMNSQTYGKCERWAIESPLLEQFIVRLDLKPTLIKSYISYQSLQSYRSKEGTVVVKIRRADDAN